MRFQSGENTDTETAMRAIEEEQERIEKRLKKFGTTLPVIEKEKKKARKERFGVKSKRDVKLEERLKKKERSDRFNTSALTPEEEDLRRKRVERFASGQKVESQRQVKRIK